MTQITPKISLLIKQKALELGFNAVGISKAEELQGYKEHYTKWLKADYNAQMEYMERNIDKRTNPTVLVENAQSVISLILSYYPEKQQPKDIPQISKYAYGIDYHFVVKDKMQQLWDYIFELYPSLSGRIFVDSAPIPDKLWAVKSGLGWVGKNSCLINKEIGSFVFVSELVVNIELEYDKPYTSNYCGSCTKCIDACPTNAIVQPGIIDSNLCISYQTIENKTDSIPVELKGKFANRLFGCDICQDVCPWNRNPITTNIEEFTPSDKLLTLNFTEWENMDKEEFNKLFKKSPLKRAKYEGLKRNLEFLKDKE